MCEGQALDGHDFLRQSIAMNPLEIAASALLLVNIALVARRSIWNYPFAIAAVSLYAVLFYETKLYSDMLLQGFYVALNLYGWFNWSRSKAEAGEVVVRMLTWPARAAWLAGCAALTGGWGWLMHRLTDAAMPWWDAGVAMTSVAAQILLSRRYLENWVLWIAVDIVAVPLFAMRGLWLTAGVYAILLGLSVWGLIDWRRAYRRRAAA